MMIDTRSRMGAVLAGGLLFGLPAAARADGTGYGYGHEMMWGGGWWAMIFGPVMMIAVVAAIIVVTVLIVRWLGGAAPGGGPAARTPLDILKERYARGEIEKEEFEERRRLLGE